MAGNVRKRMHPPSKAHPQGLVSWQASLELSPDPQTGARRAKRQLFPTKREAQLALAEWQVAQSRGELVKRTVQTIKEMTDYWLEAYVAGLKARTQDDYRWEVEHHVTPHLGRLKVQALEAHHLVAWHATLRKEGKSPRAIRHAHLRLTQALDQAVTLQMAGRNVARTVDPPRVPKSPERPTWTAEDAQAFLSVARDQCIYGPIFRVSLATGMRRGELLGVRWSDIDWHGKRLHVRQSMGPIANKMTPGTPKSANSDRAVELTETLLAILREHRTHQKTQRVAAGAAWTDSDLVFASEVGTAIAARNLHREYRRLEELAGVPHITIHDQRHTVASWAAADGIDPRTAAEQLGHDPKVLLAIYTHSSRDQKRRAAHTLEARLTNPPAPPADASGTDPH